MVRYIGRSGDQIGATSLVLSPDSIKANTAPIYDTIFANGTYTFSSLSGWIPGTEISTLYLMGAGGDGYHGGTAGPAPRDGGGGGGGAMAIKRVAKTGGLDSVSFTVTLPAGGSELDATLTCPEFGVSLTAGAGYNAGPTSPVSTAAGPGGTATGGDLNHSGGDGKPNWGGGGGAGGRWGPGGDGGLGGPNTGGGGGGFGGAPGFTGGTASPNPGWGGGGGSISGGVQHTPPSLIDDNSGPATGAGGLRKEAIYVGQPYTTRASYGDFNFPGPGGAGAPAPAAGQPGGYGGGGGGAGKNNAAKKGGDGGFGGGGGAFSGSVPSPMPPTYTISAGNGGHGGGGGGGLGGGPGPVSGSFNTPTVKLGAKGGNSALIVLFG